MLSCFDPHDCDLNFAALAVAILSETEMTPEEALAALYKQDDPLDERAKRLEIILRMHAQGFSLRQIARELGCSRQAVHERLKRYQPA